MSDSRIETLGQGQDSTALSASSQHLPECIWQECTHGSTHCRCGDCICDRLRACEQRVLEDDVLAAAYHGEKGYTMGYAVALNAAEAAVAAEATKLGVAPDAPVMSHFVAAIRALKERP